MKASRRKSHRRSRAVSGAPICTACRTAPCFFLPEFSERLSPRRSLDFQGAPECTGRPCFCFSSCFNRSSVHRSRQFGCGVPAPGDPFCFYQNLCGCKALPAVWVRLKAATTDWMMFRSLHVSKSPVAFAFRDATQPARESRIGAPELYRERRSDLTGRPRVLQTFRLHGFCFWEPLGADGRSPRKNLRRNQPGRVNLGARRHNACYV